MYTFPLTTHCSKIGFSIRIYIYLLVFDNSIIFTLQIFSSLYPLQTLECIHRCQICMRRNFHSHAVASQRLIFYYCPKIMAFVNFLKVWLFCSYNMNEIIKMGINSKTDLVQIVIFKQIWIQLCSEILSKTSWASAYLP